MKRFGIVIGTAVLLAVVLIGWWFFSRQERGTTGSISTNFKWPGPNDKIAGSPKNSISTVPIMRWSPP